MFETLLKKVVRELTKSDIPYMVTGGQAVLIYGEPRLTRDIDITVGLGTDGLEKVISVVKRSGLKVLVENVAEFVNKTMVLPVMDEGSGIRVDFTFSFSLYERQAIERAKVVKIGKVPIRFASLEDLIIHKTIAGRARDIEDIKSILLKNPHYDSQYISRWLTEFDNSLNENFHEVLKRIEEEIK